MNIRINKKYGIVFWITGLSGSGKSSIGKNIFNQISKTYGPTILIHGDNIRKIFKLKKYDKQNRKLYGYMYSDLCKYLQNQKINIIITVGGLFHDLHKYNKKKIKNYCEIFIKSSLKKIIEYKKKKIYKKKKNIWGIDIIPEYPTNPTIRINNNFTDSIKKISNKLFNKIIIKLK